VRVLRQFADGLTTQKRHAESEQVLRRALHLAPTSPDTLARLASALAAQDRPEQALREFRRAVALRPEFPEALVNMGVVLKALKHEKEAEECYRQALALRPTFAEAHCNLGGLLLTSERFEEAVHHCQEAVRLNSGLAEAQANLGAALAATGLPDQARQTYAEALRLRPLDAETHANLGLLEQSQSRFAEALECFDRALELQPNDARTRAARAMNLLTQGDFERGWQEYEWRLRCDEFGTPPILPRWKGDSLKGRTILLWSEQGLGDTLQFVRYAGLLKERGATVVLECQPQLKAILSCYSGVDALCVRGDPRPQFDFFVPLMSLPWMLDTTLETVPTPIPYLHADPALIARWGSRLAEGSPARKRIGICWRGHPKNKGDKQRSFRLRDLEALSKIDGVELISLQKHIGTDELSLCGEGFRVRQFADLDEAAGPFMDTAAILHHLALLVSCDSSVAHLAGAMGKPVWLALPYSAEWRWLLKRQESPWYPRHRLFRQRRAGDWEAVFAEIARELAHFCRE